MNIFVLDTNPEQAAKYHCNAHVVKMVLETAQILCTAHQFHGRPTPEMYAATHTGHPCTRWAMRSTGNYKWLYRLFCALCDEYTYRYGRIHKTDRQLRAVLKRVPSGLGPNGLTPFETAMPVDYIDPSDAVKSYRAYYRLGKGDLLQFGYRGPPDWLEAFDA